MNMPCRYQRVLGLVLLVSFVSVAHNRSYGAAPENLLANPGFEQGNKGWKLYDHTGGRSSFAVETDAHSGEGAARLTLTGPPKGVNGCIEQIVSRKGLGGKRYRYSLWVKCAEKKIAYQMACIYEFPVRKRHWVKPTQQRDGWAQYATVFESRSNATHFAVDVYIRHTGTLLVDDIVLAEYAGPVEKAPERSAPETPVKAPPRPAKPSASMPRSAEWQAATEFFKTHKNSIDFRQQGNRLLLANRRVGLEIRQSERGFEVSRLYSVKDDQGHLYRGQDGKLPNLFQIVMRTDPAQERRGLKGSIVVGNVAAKDTSFRVAEQGSQSTLHLVWKGIDLRDDKAVMDIEVAVTLKADDPLSYWRFNIRNRSIKYGIARVYFPVLNIAPIGEPKANVYIYPRVRGGLVEDPFNKPPGYGDGVHQSGRYPAAFGMQFQALYNKQTGVGLYLGTQDPAPNLKNTEQPNYPTHITWKPGHRPPNINFAYEDYALPFDCVVGPFNGDWWDACQVYRKWALKQTWCRKGPLATRKDIPKWYKESPIFLTTGSWSNDGNVAKTVEHYLKFLKWAGTPLPCNWYGWKFYRTEMTAYDMPHSYWRVNYRRDGPCSNAHDGNYPALPALPSFAAACKRLRDAGGMVCPYVCLQIYDQGPAENAPYADQARPHVVRDLQGNMQTYGREPSWAMCTWSQWWRDRLKESCVELYKREHSGGFYLDTMHGAGEYCYWTPHGHTAGGGSALPAGMHGLSEYIRDAVKAVDPQLITTGEDPAENMIDIIDGKLYQHTLTPNSVAPLFAAVYQDYIPRYGMRLNPEDGEGFYMSAASLFVEGAQLGRLRVDPHGPGLRFDDEPAHKEARDYIGRFVGYYRQDMAKKFLCYGQLMRPLTFHRPAPMPIMSYTTGGRKIALPSLLSGVFRARDGEVGIFIVNAGKQPLSFVSNVELARHGLTETAGGQVQQITPEGKAIPAGAFSNGTLALKGTLPARHVTLFRLQPR